MHQQVPLVIGLGNSLRSDDGAGMGVAEALAAKTSCVTVRVCQQLAPDLAAEIDQAPAVLFIDSVVPGPSNEHRPTLKPIPSIEIATSHTDSGDPFSHALTPERLLALTLALYDHCPPSWQLLIPGRQWDVGDALSPATRQACQEALSLALEWVAAHA